MDGILGKPINQPEGSVFECLDGLMRGRRVGWGVSNRMLWERVESGGVQVERLEKANAGQAVEIEQVGMTRGGRSHGACTDETNDTGSNPMGGWWCISREGGDLSYITVTGFKGHRDWDGCENWLASVGVIENGEQIVCQCPRDRDGEPCGGEKEDGVGEGEDWEAGR